jgi:hypothetical protein
MRHTSEAVDSRCRSVSEILGKIGLGLEVVPYRAYGHTDLCFRERGQSGLRSIVQGLTTSEAFDCVTSMQGVMIEVWNGLVNGNVRITDNKNEE